MEAKNLIALKQIRQSELSGFISVIASGIFIGGESGVRFGIASGVDTINCTYNSFGARPKIYVQICNSGAGESLIYAMPDNVNATGCDINLSAPVTSVNYYLNLDIRP